MPEHFASFVLGIALALLLAPSRAVAEAGPEAGGSRGAFYEISPTAGMMGGSPLLGARAAMNYHPITLEASAEQVMGRTATLYPFTVNALLDLAPFAKAVPFAIVGAGLFLTVPSNTVGQETISTVGAKFGGGLRFYFTRRMGLRFETKQIFTLVDTGVEGQSDARQELLIFQSTSLGVLFAFDG